MQFSTRDLLWSLFLFRVVVFGIYFCNAVPRTSQEHTLSVCMYVYYSYTVDMRDKANVEKPWFCNFIWQGVHLAKASHTTAFCSLTLRSPSVIAYAMNAGEGVNTGERDDEEGKKQHIEIPKKMEAVCIIMIKWARKDETCVTSAAFTDLSQTISRQENVQ